MGFGDKFGRPMQVQGQKAATPQKPKIAVALQDEFGRVPLKKKSTTYFT
jgi:hypothetical protein